MFVGFSVGFLVGEDDATGFLVGVSVGFLVGLSVGFFVGEDDTGFLVGAWVVGVSVGFFVGEKVGFGVAGVTPPETAKTMSSMSSYPLDGHANGFDALALPVYRITTLTA